MRTQTKPLRFLICLGLGILSIPVVTDPAAAQSRSRLDRNNPDRYDYVQERQQRARNRNLPDRNAPGTTGDPRVLNLQEPVDNFGHFKSGGQQSAQLLAEILLTLKQIDARLQNIEAQARQWQGGPGQLRPAPPDSRPLPGRLPALPPGLQPTPDPEPARSERPGNASGIGTRPDNAPSPESERSPPPQTDPGRIRNP